MLCMDVNLETFIYTNIVAASHICSHTISLCKNGITFWNQERFFHDSQRNEKDLFPKKTLHTLWSNKTFTPSCTISASSKKISGNLKQKKRPPKTWVGSLNLVFSRAFQPSRTLKLVGIVRFWPPSWFWKIPVNTAQLFPGWGEAWLALVYCFFCPWNTSLFRSSQQWG